MASDSIPTARVDGTVSEVEAGHEEYPLLKRIYDEAGAATVQVFRSNGTGSGFCVENGSKIVTNEHVIRGEHLPIYVDTAQGDRVRGLISKIDPVNDLAVIELQDGKKCQKSIKIDSSKPEANEDWFGLGHPLGIPRIVVSPGKFVESKPFYELDKKLMPEHVGDSSIDEWADRRLGSEDPGFREGRVNYYRSTRHHGRMLITHGSSGGPIVDSDAELKAVASIGYFGDNITHTANVPAGRVEELLKNESLYKFQYEKVNSFRAHPESTIAVNGLFASSLLRPRTIGAGVGVIAAYSLYDQATNPDRNWSEASFEDRLSRATLIGRDISAVTGAGLSRFPKTGKLGKIGLAAALTLNLAEDLIPRFTYLTGITNEKGEANWPMFWKGKD